jgi:phosphate transport system protein
MGSLAEEAIALAIKALNEQDAGLAREVIDGDERVNELEMEIDNGIVDLLALQQPVAIDLRLILAAQKINNDLERIGDHAVNIAESVIGLLRFDPEDELLEIPQMTEVAQEMLRNALDAFIHQDPQLGRKVLEQDDTIDAMNRELVLNVVERMKGNPKMIEIGLELIRISRNLERVADLATNIAEDVIFITQAKVVKHRAEEKKQGA